MSSKLIKGAITSQPILGNHDATQLFDVVGLPWWQELERLDIAAIKKGANRHEIVRSALNDYFRELSAEFPHCTEVRAAQPSYPACAEGLDSAILAMETAKRGRLRLSNAACSTFREKTCAFKLWTPTTFPTAFLLFSNNGPAYHASVTWRRGTEVGAEFSANSPRPS